MTIKITFPSRITAKTLRGETKKLIQSNFANSQICSNNYFIIEGTHVLIQKRDVLLTFNSNDCNEVNCLRRYVSHLFRGAILGVDYENPVTTHLNGVKEYLYY